MPPQLALLPLFMLVWAGCTGPPTMEPTDSSRPATSPDNTEYGISWRPGDYWVQRAYDESNPEETLETIDYFVEAPHTLDGVPALRVISSDQRRLLWVRAIDGALLKERYGEEERVHDPPCNHFLGLLKGNQSWDHSCYRVGTRRPSLEDRPETTLRTHATGPGNVSVPAGTFNVQTYETRSGETLLITESYASQACFPVRVVTAERTRTIVLDLVTFSCANRELELDDSATTNRTEATAQG